MPKFHELNDNINDLVAVARDVLHHRQRVPKPWPWSAALQLCSCRLFPSKFQRMQKLFHKNLTKELDLVRLLRKQRESETLLWAMTTRAQRRMARWQSKYVARMKNQS